MLGGLKGFFANQGVGPDWSPIAAWAKRRGHVFKRARDHTGFAIDGQLDGQPWRLEWGPSQRAYIEGQELRLRMDLALPPDLQLLCLTRTLNERLEKEAYEQFTQSNQTQMGDTSPEEQRWLVMFPKMAFDGSKLLRQNFGGVSGVQLEGASWVGGPLGHALERALGTFLAGQPPFVLITTRGKVYLRLALGSVEEDDIAGVLGLFETAGTEALRIAKARSGEQAGWSQTLSSAWQAIGAPEPSERR